MDFLSQTKYYIYLCKAINILIHHIIHSCILSIYIVRFWRLPPHSNQHILHGTILHIYHIEYIKDQDL